MARSDLPAGTDPDDFSQPFFADLRFGVRGCLVGLVLAYVLVFPLKWAGLMPEHLTWLGLTLAPAALFGTFGSIFAGGLWLRERWWLLFLPVAFLSCGVMLGLILARSGW